MAEATIERGELKVITVAGGRPVNVQGIATNGAIGWKINGGTAFYDERFAANAILTASGARVPNLTTAVDEIELQLP